MRLTPHQGLKVLLYFIAIFHLVMGLGLMVSIDFQQWAASIYTGQSEWTVRDVYYSRILGSFAFVLGTFALAAAKNPLKHQIIVIGFIEFFILRNISRHVFAEELTIAYGVTPLVNIMTSVFFGVQAMALAVLLWWTKCSTQAQE